MVDRELPQGEGAARWRRGDVEHGEGSLMEGVSRRADDEASAEPAALNPRWSLAGVSLDH